MGSVIKFLQSPSAFRLGVFILAMLACCFAGGSSRPDAIQLIALRGLLVIALTAVFFIPYGISWDHIRLPIVLTAVFAATMLIQLIPIPPSWWLLMPGHADFAMSAAGSPQPWRPISMSPDMTTNSVLSLLPAALVFGVYGGVCQPCRHAMSWVFLGAVAIDYLFSVAQIVSNADSWLFLYGQGADGVPTGFFANRNHHAVFLALAIPLTGGVAWRYESENRLAPFAVILVSALVAPLIMLSGSRAGLALGTVALVLTLAMMYRRGSFGRGRRLGVALGLGALFPTTIGAFTVAAGRALSINRLSDFAAGDSDMRVQALPTLFKIVEAFSPFGIGYGAFDPIYRRYEPEAFLYEKYFNHAHNDLIELVMTGGWLVLVPAIMFLTWYVDAARLMFRYRKPKDVTASLGLAGWIIVFIIICASFVDYPLRTPMFSIVFVLCCCWISECKNIIKT